MYEYLIPKTVDSRPPSQKVRIKKWVPNTNLNPRQTFSLTFCDDRSLWWWIITKPLHICNTISRFVSRRYNYCDTLNSSYRSDVLDMFLIVSALICCIIFVLVFLWGKISVYIFAVTHWPLDVWRQLCTLTWHITHWPDICLLYTSDAADE